MSVIGSIRFILHSNTHPHTRSVWCGSLESMIRLIAWTEEDALQKAERLLPDRTYSVIAVCEYWMPGVNLEVMAKALEKVNQNVVQGR